MNSRRFAIFQQQDDAAPPPQVPYEDLNRSSPSLEPTPEPAPRAPQRIPNLGHAALFVAFTGVTLLLAQVVLILMGKLTLPTAGNHITIQHPKLLLAAQGVPYLLTLLAAWLLFPLMWGRPFLDGVAWRWPIARTQIARLVSVGLLLGAMSTAVEYFLPAPKTVLLDDFFLRSSDAWLITLFGTIVAPVFEETCFRGFLFPAFAIAYDWFSLPRTEEARMRWQNTTALTPIALVFSSILTSILFALLHGQQIGYSWSALSVLFAVSLVLTFIRAKTDSVASSALVHGSYNFFVFLMVIIATGGYRHLDRMTR